MIVATRYAIGAIFVLVSILGVLSQGRMAADANHLNCRQYDGNDNNNTFNALNDDVCDEAWMYGGDDLAIGNGGGDYLAMSAGADEAHGQRGQDEIYGGENGNTYADLLYAGDADDTGIADTIGPDKDVACGGDGQERILVNDNDGLDTAKGEGNPAGAQDQVTGDPGLGDNINQDGNC